MTHEHDLARKRGAPSALDHNDNLAPGRRSQSSQMHAPDVPLVGGLLQRKTRDANGVAAGAEDAVAAASSSSSVALPDDLRARFECSTGADLSGVRLHTGNESAEAAHAVGAHAYTVGQDIHFAAGKYAPSDPSGMHLLAHEVAHTVQQRGVSPTTQYKLEVSTPHDASEVEADHAADAMVRGDSVSIGSGSGLGRKVFRDGPPPAADTATKPADAATAAAGADDKTTLTWWLGWVNKETGETVSSKSNARTGKDAATGALKILPVGGDASVFNWVNAASSGEVKIATTQQPKGQGGQVSTDVAFGAPPSASASVKVQETSDDPKRRGQAQLPAKQKAATAAASTVLHNELQASGNLADIEKHMQDAAKNAVGTGGPGYTFDVSVAIQPMKLDSQGGHSRALAPVSYAAPTGAKEDRHVTVTVTTNRQTLKGTKSAEQQDMNSQADSHQVQQQDASSAANSSTTDTEFESTTCASVESIVSKAFDEFARKITTKSLSAEGGIDGSIAADQSGKVGITDLEVDFGFLSLALGEVLGPEAALLLSKVLGKGKIGGVFSAGFKGELKAGLKGSASWTEEDLKQAMASAKSQVTTKFSKEIRTKVHTIVTQQASESHQTDTLDKKERAGSTIKKSSATTETIGVKFDIGEPTITVK